jgi:hypothetical protein
MLRFEARGLRVNSALPSRLLLLSFSCRSLGAATVGRVRQLRCLERLIYILVPLWRRCLMVSVLGPAACFPATYLNHVYADATLETIIAI